MADKNFKVKKNIQVTDLAVAGPVTVDSSGILASSSALPVNLGGTGQTSASAAFDALVPSQTNNANKLLGTDGTSVSWVSPGIAYQTSAPDNPVTGQLWVDSDETGDSLDPYIIRRKTITATAGQTVFTTDVVFTDGYEQIYYNGVLLVRTTDYTTSGSTNTVTLLQGASAGDTVEIISSTPINLINTVTTNSANTITASTASSTPLKIVGASSQSADLFEILNSSSAELFAVRSNGRIKSSIISTEVDSTILGLHANANNGSSGTSVILWGKDMTTWGGDVHYLADSRGASGGHRFWNWDGTNFLQRAIFDKTGKLGVGTDPTYPIDLSYSNSAGGINETGLRIRNTSTANSTQINLNGNRSWSIQVEGSFGSPAGGFSLVDNTAGANRFSIDSSGLVNMGVLSSTQFSPNVTLTDSTVRTYTANTWYTLPGTLPRPIAGGASYYLQVYFQYNGNSWHGYCGAGVLGVVQWKFSGTHPTITFPLDRHAEDSINVSVRSEVGNGTTQISVNFSSTISVADGGFVQIKAKRMF
jgi:hypothetical protein